MTEHRRRTSTWLWGLLAATMLHPSPAVLWSAEEGERVPFDEPFTAKMVEGWTWIRENPKAWRIEDGTLVVQTLPGYLHANYNNSQNVLLRAPPDTNDQPLAFEVSLESEPKEQFEHAGLVWFNDDDNYVALLKEVLDGKVKIQVVTEKAKKPAFIFKEYEGKTVLLRMQVAKGKVICQFRATESDPWQTVGETQLPHDGAGKVGVITGGAPEAANRLVRFRNFRIVAF